jgi:N-acetylmuramoyl-L-alanine amidase
MTAIKTRVRDKKASDLKNRLEIVNEHPEAIFISIHMNTLFPKSVRARRFSIRKTIRTAPSWPDMLQASLIENAWTKQTAASPRDPPFGLSDGKYQGRRRFGGMRVF